ncbi:MAG: host nuclease inhibitor protein [Emcibacter sp.]|nr:host nuclease inhibitor protein [Emcibacter sp.]
MSAYVWRTGLIEFGRYIPKGALPLWSGRKSIIEVIARHSRHNNDLFVPGVPEAENDVEAMEAMLAFNDEIIKRLAARRKKKEGELV